MRGLDLDATIRRCIAALLEASYVDDIPSVTTDRWRWVAADASRDLGALITRLRAAESEASSAGVLRCKLTHEEAQTEAAGRALEMVAPGLLAEHGAIFSAVLELGARLRAAEARIERVGAILSDEGCDCYCDCDSDGHNADCDLCLACRIDREVSP